MNSMLNSTIHFSEHSAWWLLLCILIASAYAFLLYYPAKHFSLAARRLLAAARWLLVFMLMVFLFSPFITSTSSREEKPIIIFAQDNSASLLQSNRKDFYQNQYLADLTKFKEKCADKFDVQIGNFGESISFAIQKPNFSAPKTAIAATFQQIEKSAINRNIAAVVLASDGINNIGQQPLTAAQQLAFPVYTVCMGDPRAQKDISIKDVQVNEVVFKDASFPVNVNLKAYALKGKSASVAIYQKEKLISKSSVNINQGNFFCTVPYSITASTVGLQTYTVKVQSIVGEQNRYNNTFQFYVNVLESKKKILLLAHAAHPDLAALQTMITANQHYELSTLIDEEVSSKDLAKYQLLILHQLPSGNQAAFDVLQKAKELSIPILYILGPQTYIDLYNRQANANKIFGSNSKSSEATALVNSAFYFFNLSDETKNILPQLPPLNAPFGNYQTQGNAQLLLQQQIGNVATSLPLLSFETQQNTKSATLFGDGIWRWRLANFQLANNDHAVAELVQKTIQFLVLQTDNRKFNVRLENKNLLEGEEINFHATLYNDSYQSINSPDVQLKIKNSKGQAFDYVFAKNAINYDLLIAALPAGDYNFEAKTQLGTTQYKDKGNFTIRVNQLEQSNTRADFDMLAQMAKQTGGLCFKDTQLSELADSLLSNTNYKKLAYAQTTSDELIDFPWILVLLLALAGLEWFSRKRLGYY